MKPPRQESLFGDEPAAPAAATPLTLSFALAAKPKNKEQAAFQKLVAQIERLRQQLSEWRDYGVRHRQRVGGELLPLQEKLRERQRELVLRIDERLSAPPTGRALGRRQVTTLKQMLLGLLDELLSDGDDDELIVIFDRYSGRSHAEERDAELQMTQAIIEESLGVEIGDDHGAQTAEDLIEHARRLFDEQAQRETQQRQARAERRRAKGGKAQAEQERKEQAQRDASHSVREVFRKLASALHPDREPDPAERERKTALMQRVNQAYEANDLLTLLSLQLEIELVDAQALATLSEQRLQHYTRVLREQLAELKAELEHETWSYCAVLGCGPQQVRIAQVERALEDSIGAAKQLIAAVESDLQAVADPARIAAWLREYREALAAMRAEQQDDDAFWEDLSPPPSRSRKRR
jgi:RNAse (barnase) inhibitor barstar